MTEKKSTRPIWIILAAGFTISALSMTYLITSSKSQLGQIKTSGEATLSGPKGETFKLIPEECVFQLKRGVTNVVLNSHNHLDLIIQYNVAVDASLTTLTLTLPNDTKPIIFKKAECEKFDDKVNPSSASGMLDVACAQNEYHLKGLLRFGACKS